MKLLVIRFLLKIPGSEKGDVKKREEALLTEFKVTKVLSELRVIKQVNMHINNNIYVSELNSLIGYLQNLTL